VPNLRFLHTRLNLDTPVDLEIYNGLMKYPEGERSKVVRLALLAYIKEEVGREGRLVRKSRTKRPERNQGVGPIPTASHTPLPTPAGEIREPDRALEELPVNSEDIIKDLLKLVQ
jgi:hypothetical protein